MEPNNFEKDFREKLNQREIEPSDKAWDRLDAMLSVAENKKSTVRLGSLQASKKRWMYVAASIVGFLLVGTFFFNQKKNTIETPKNNVAVEENIQKGTTKKQNLLKVDSIENQVVVSEKEAIQNSENSIAAEKKSNPNQNKNIKNEVKQIAESSIINQKNQQSQTVINQTAVPETSKNEVTDQLLNVAEKNVVAENLAKPKSKVKINANDLLNQVDGELELSFREKVITKVNKNYQTVKVALANRNQQE
ncbi:hypothetical protein GKZ90_0017540 [Flavobacterium sp. MC2016-06]|uniref:hypothetical protein n=1 Tax=Flavobacterium sp. MC2016-06 TaxID=2676308 RepID=UPI0012BAE999|nr:hypothetical protein [Flavobacterium sp. MC2016-06]MBU3860374.1 hypothetical protein [Flavobacterium sp. MC2016-06]